MDLPRLRFGTAFGTICAGGTYGTREDKKTGGDAEAAAREGGHAAAVQGPESSGSSC